MLKWFKSGEQSPAPHLQLRALMQDARAEATALTLLRDACGYLYTKASPVHPTYLYAERTIRVFASDVLGWKLSSDREDVITAFVWAFAFEVVNPSAGDTVAAQLLDVLVANGAEVSACRERLVPKGLRKVLNLGVAKFEELTQKVDSIVQRDAEASHVFLTDRFMTLRSAGYLSWHSTVGSPVREKFPGLIPYRSLRSKQ